MSSIITEASWKLTSSILEAQIRETPYVSETNRKPNQRKDEIKLSNPRFSHIFGGTHHLTSFIAQIEDASPLRTWLKRGVELRTRQVLLLNVIDAHINDNNQMAYAHFGRWGKCGGK